MLGHRAAPGVSHHQSFETDNSSMGSFGFHFVFAWFGLFRPRVSVVATAEGEDNECHDMSRKLVRHRSEELVEEELTLTQHTIDQEARPIALPGEHLVLWRGYLGSEQNQMRASVLQKDG